jgi:hypothetical protein
VKGEYEKVLFVLNDEHSLQRNITKETVIDLAEHAILFGCGEEIVKGIFK